MAISVQMPALGESVTDGTVTRWLKSVGDTVAAARAQLDEGAFAAAWAAGEAMSLEQAIDEALQATS